MPSTGYDRYGNLLTINVTKCSAPALSISVNGNNRITNSGFTYDASGDETADGLYSYTWDAEGRMTSGAGVTYTYDGGGQRVKKSSGTLYWRGAVGTVLAETDTSGNTTNEYIFFGARIARRDSGGNVYYYFGNHLGSATITNATGTLCYDADFYPIGGELAFTNNCSQTYKFAGMEQDSETGDYHTWFRQYTPNLGRWLSPDPLGGDTTNPQSLNRYAYVLNSPTSLIDPLGLQSNGNGPCYEYYCPPSYGGPPPGTGPPPCWTSWCLGPNGTWVWNEPNPFGSESAAAEQNYANPIMASFLAGSSLSRQYTWTLGGVTYTWVPGTFIQIGDLIQISTGYWRSSPAGDTSPGSWGVLSAFIPGRLAPSQIWQQAARVLTNTVSDVIEKPGVPNPQVAPEALPETVWGNIARDTAHFLFEAAEIGGATLVDFVVIMNPRLMVPGYGQPQISPEM